MGYIRIENLYRPWAQRILLFKEVYALEKVHGSSAHIGWRNDKVIFFSGGSKYEDFVNLFDRDALTRLFTENFPTMEVIVFGEAYGGRLQGMKDTYGNQLRFIAFDVLIGSKWLDVPNAEQVATQLGLEFVPWVKIPATIEALNAERDRPSEVARRRGFENKLREGIVIRTPIEVRTNNGTRLIAKHKGDAFAERIHQPKVSKEKLEVIEEADKVAVEWVTEMRLSHVLDALCPDTKKLGIEDTRLVINAMVEDVTREAKGEIVESKEAIKAISGLTAKLFHNRLKSQLKEN